MGNGFLESFVITSVEGELAAYATLYVSTIILGNIAAFAGFWAALGGSLGTWGPLFTILVVFAAEASGDVLWYTIGRSLRDTKVGTWLKNHLPYHRTVERHLQKNAKRWIFFSKFSYLTAFPIIFMVGWSRFNFKTFFKTSLLALLAWQPVFIGLGYGLFSGLSYLKAAKIVQHFELLAVIGIVLALALEYAIGKGIGRVFGKNGNGE